MIGHTAYFAGVASKDGADVAFTAALDVSEGTQMVGAPFELSVEADTKAEIGVQLEATDPVEGKSMFDGLDFGALDDDGDGRGRHRAGHGGPQHLRADDPVARALQRGGEVIMAMQRWLMFTGALVLAACSEDAGAELTVRAWGEEYIEEGIPAEEFG
jgi:hypothetical protein